MKVCDKCGAVNSDNRFFCVDCNEKLGDPVSDRERERLEDGIDRQLERLYNDNDPLYVSRFDKVMGALALVGLIASIILWIVGLVTRREFGFLGIGMLFFGLTAVEAFLPKVTWSLEQIRLSFRIDHAEDAEPSMFYKTARKASIVLGAIIGTTLLIIAAMAW